MKLPGLGQEHDDRADALLAQEPVAFRTVITTGVSPLKVQMPATAPPWLRVHASRRLLRRPVTARHSGSTRSSGLVRCEGFGHGGICRHSSPIGLPRWNREMGCLQRMQTGAMKASLRLELGGGHAFGDCAECAATRSTDAGRGTTGYYMACPARAESSFLPGRPPVGSERPRRQPRWPVARDDGSATPA